MKERPILFSGPMVRAILAGTKTQTRRTASKPVRHPDLGNLYTPGALVLEREPQHVIDRCCPYGRPGDRLWVRETWAGPLHDPELPFQRTDIESPKYCLYAADGGPRPEFFDADDNLCQRWTPSIHMPRWASRILLEVTDVRVERLKDISKADAIAEGAPPPSHPSIDKDWHQLGHPDFFRSWYRQLWKQINGPGSWDVNPWVWVVSFRRIA